MLSRILAGTGAGDECDLTDVGDALAVTYVRLSHRHICDLQRRQNHFVDHVNHAIAVEHVGGHNV
jgi:hypothetical protein